MDNISSQSTHIKSIKTFSRNYFNTQTLLQAVHRADKHFCCLNMAISYIVYSYRTMLVIRILHRRIFIIHIV